MVKLCSKCKSPGKFYKNKRARDGLQSQCSICHHVYTKKSRKKFELNNPGYNTAKTRERRANKPGEHTAYQKAWAKINRGKCRAIAARYDAAKLNRTPKWLTEAHIIAMNRLYIVAQQASFLGKEYHVDHIVPLRGRNVSGLHVPWNLQLLPKSLNCSKGNRF